MEPIDTLIHATANSASAHSGEMMQYSSFAMAAIDAFSYLVEEDNFVVTVEDESCFVRFRSRGYEPSGEGDGRFGSYRDRGTVLLYAIPERPSAHSAAGIGEFLGQNTGWQVCLMLERGSSRIELSLKKNLFCHVYMDCMREILTASEVLEVSSCHYRDGQSAESRDMFQIARIFKGKWRMLKSMTDVEYSARVVHPSHFP